MIFLSLPVAILRTSFNYILYITFIEKASEFCVLKFFIYFFAVGPCLSVNMALCACVQIPYIGFSESFKGLEKENYFSKVPLSYFKLSHHHRFVAEYMGRISWRWPKAKADNMNKSKVEAHELFHMQIYPYYMLLNTKCTFKANGLYCRRSDINGYCCSYCILSLFSVTLIRIKWKLKVLQILE